MIIESFDTDRRPMVIAEIGNNHEGNAGVAAEMIEAAAAAGVDAVKLQTYRTELFIRRVDAERFAKLESFRLPMEEVTSLAKLARSKGLLFLSTPLDLPSADDLAPLVDAYKIASSDIDFFPLLDRVAVSGKPLILSTGMSHGGRVARGVARILAASPGNWHDRLALLHCVSAYPAAPEETSLGAIATLAERFSYTVGYSDHTLGIEAAVLSVAAGAKIIEKHFTLDHHHSDFRDHLLSADPEEMTALVTRVRETTTLMGSGEKKIQQGEEPVRDAVRRGIVAVTDLPAGHELCLGDLAWVRAGAGLLPGEEHRLVGKCLKAAVRSGDPLTGSEVI